MPPGVGFRFGDGVFCLPGWVRWTIIEDADFEECCRERWTRSLIGRSAVTVGDGSAKVSNTIKAKVIEQLETLPENLQRQVLEFVRALQMFARRGVPGEQLLQFAGAVPLDDLELMRQAIEDECEQVDLNEW